MKVLVESFPDNAVGVDGDANLLKHCIDIGVEFGLATLIHENDGSASFLDISSHVLQLLRSERQSWAAK